MTDHSKRQRIPLFTHAESELRKLRTAHAADSAAALTAAFMRARETIAALESAQLEHVGRDWSPAQFARVA